MSTKTQSKLIDGNTYEVTQLPAMQAHRLKFRLAKALAPSLASLATMQGAKTLGEVDLGVFAGALGGILGALTVDEYEGLTRELLKTATVDGKPLMPAFDLVMQGKTFTIDKLMWFALGVNYSDFSDGLRGLIAASKTAAPASAVSTT